MNPEKEEYELQHFNFCSEDLVNENRLLVKSLIQQSLLDFTDEFVKKHKVSDEAAMELRSKCYTTANTMFAECNSKLEELSQLYRDTFTIPDNILLPSDFLQKKNCTAEQVQTLQSRVDALDKQFQQDGVFLALLQDEIKLHERLALCIESETKLMDLVDQYRHEEIVPAEDLDLVEELATLMQDVLHTQEL
ncbi:uncharacterized protein LOC129767541 [Toxorhynchites rutilus septentrionalis]|uniref:uncharacterized protein LOC129767541 n=1 Tax=Toxorhynchites rutilus septentrionalis TaxID=329112 RepID=UPI0024794C82|nr:uncharacterized protein LOC129767541 [Toxorhynchites rutilus septentrionalis]